MSVQLQKYIPAHMGIFMCTSAQCTSAALERTWFAGQVAERNKAQVTMTDERVCEYDRVSAELTLVKS